MNRQSIEKVLTEEEISEIEALTPEQLKEQIVKSEQCIKAARDELEANPKYQELKDSLKALRCGFSGVKKRQGAIIALALITLGDNND